MKRQFLAIMALALIVSLAIPAFGMVHGDSLWPENSFVIKDAGNTVGEVPETTNYIFYNGYNVILTQSELEKIIRFNGEAVLCKDNAMTIPNDKDEAFYEIVIEKDKSVDIKLLDGSCYRLSYSDFADTMLDIFKPMIAKYENERNEKIKEKKEKEKSKRSAGGGLTQPLKR